MEDITTETEHQATRIIAPSQQEIQNIYDYAIMLISDGKSNEEVTDMMVTRGLDAKESATMVVLLRQQIAQAKVDKANKDMLYGALWCVGGLVVTGVSYSAVSEGGGSYLMCWGAVIFGGIQFFRGLAASSGAKAELEAAGGSPSPEPADQSGLLQ